MRKQSGGRRPVKFHLSANFYSAFIATPPLAGLRSKAEAGGRKNYIFQLNFIRLPSLPCNNGAEGDSPLYSVHVEQKNCDKWGAVVPRHDGN